MDFNEYQKESRKTAIYAQDGALYGTPIVYVALGLAGESGEVVEKIKKLIRNDKGVVTDEFRKDLTKEIGDVLWYITQMATELDITLDDIAQSNIKKLQSRLLRGTLHSVGDDR